MNARIWLSGSAGIAALAAGLITIGSGGTAHAETTSGKNGVLSGNQVTIPVNLPITIQGNAVGVLGSAKARSSGKTTTGRASSGRTSTSGKSGVLSGNQVNLPINAPVTACGNAVGVLGSGRANCKSSVSAGTGKAKGKGKGGARTSGAGGIGSGNQVLAPVTAPVTACGNAAGVLGHGKAACKARVKAGSGTPGNAKTSGASGIGSGNQVLAPVNAPIQVCGNAVGSATGPCKVSMAASSGNHATRPGKANKGHKATKRGKHPRTAKASHGKNPGTTVVTHKRVPAGHAPASQPASRNLPVTGTPVGSLTLIGVLALAAGFALSGFGRSGRVGLRLIPALPGWKGGGAKSRTPTPDQPAMKEGLHDSGGT